MLGELSKDELNKMYRKKVLVNNPEYKPIYIDTDSIHCGKEVKRYNDSVSAEQESGRDKNTH